MSHSKRSFGPYSSGVRLLTLLAMCLLPTLAHAQTTVPGGTISTDTTWTLAGSPYVVTGNLTVEGTDGADGVTTLTIEPGVEVRFQGQRFLYIGGSSVSVPGALVADGNAAGGPATITFTSDNGSPSAGDWNAIYFRAGSDPSSVLRNAVVEYGGASIYAGIYFYLTGGQTMTVQDVTVRDSGRYGIYQNYGTVQLTDVTIVRSGNSGLYVTSGDTTISQLTANDNGGHGIDIYSSTHFSVDGCDLGPNTNHDIRIGSSVDGSVQNCSSIESVYYAAASPVTWSGNTFNNWGATVSRVNGGDLIGLIADNTINKVGGAVVEVGTGTSALDGAWTDAVGNPYIMVGAVTVAGDDGPDGLATLTIEPGLELRFASNQRLYVGNSIGTSLGALVADGNGAGGPATITFTSDASSPASGDWIGIQFRSGAEGASLLRNAVVEYTGSSNYGALYVQPDPTATITVEDVTIRDSSHYGVYQWGGTLVMNNVEILDSGYDGLHVNSGDQQLSQLTIGANGRYAVHVSSSTFDLDGCTIEPSVSYDFQIENNVTGTVQNCSGAESIYYNTTSSRVTWSGNTFDDWGEMTSRITAGDLGGLIANNTINAVAGASVEVSPGTVDLDSTWSSEVGQPYVMVAGVVHVVGLDGPDSLTTLTLEPGLELRFQVGGTLQIGGTSPANPGALIADGDAAGGPATITFTSDSVSPAAGDWRSLYFHGGAHSSSILRNVLVQYGGQWLGAVYLAHSAGATITLDNVSILDSKEPGINQGPGDSLLSDVIISNTEGRGFHLGFGAAAMTNLTVQGAADEGLYVYSDDFSIDGCTIDSDGGFDMYLSAAASGSVQNCSLESVYYVSSGTDVTWNANTFNSWGARTSRVDADVVGELCSDNTINAVPGAILEVWGGTISRDATWTPAPGPIVGVSASTNFTIQGSDGPDSRTTLTLEPGVAIKMPSARIVVGGGSGDPGELIADGRLGGGAFSKVNFTSSHAVPATGDWGGIDVLATGRAVLHEAQIRYANTGIRVYFGTLGTFDRVTVNRANIGIDLDHAVLEEPLTASTFKNCNVAVRSDRSTPVLRGCDLTGGSWGVENLTPATDCVDALSNWWNAVDGPWSDPPLEGCEPGQATGSGSRISEAVLYSNWLDAPSDDGDAIPCDDGDGFYDPCNAGNLIDCDDNCCLVANDSQEDLDNDGTGDACDENPVLRVSNDPLDGADFDVIQDAADAAFQSGTRIEIFPGLGPYGESVLLDRLPPQVFQVVGLDTGAGPVVIDGGAGPALNAASKPLGVIPMRFRNLTLGGAEGVRALVDTDMSEMIFSTDFTALVLDGGSHDLDRSEIVGAVGAGADIATGATLRMQRTSMTGLTDAGLIVAGTAEVENSLICEGLDGIRLTASGSTTLKYTTIANHSGVGLDNTLAGAYAVEQSIVYGNAQGDIEPDDTGVACPTVSWSDVGVPDCSGSGDNLSADPLFDTEYHLQSGSTCLDHGPDPAGYTGDPPTDLDLGPRLVDHDGDGLAHADPGAFERAAAGLVPGDVQNVRWDFSFRLVWDAEPSATEYHVYRDLLSNLYYSSFGVCEDALDPVRTDTQLDDTQEPLPAQGFFYLITADTGSEEGSLGMGTHAERSNFGACP